jgi:hypothetical protein
MTDELEEIWKEAVVAQTRYDPGIFLDGLRKTTKHEVRMAGVAAAMEPST